jgi:hypothetical protein
MGGRQEHQRPRPQSDALAVMSVWTSMVPVGWYPRIKDLVANPYGGLVGVQNSRHDNLRKLPIGLVGRLRGVELRSHAFTGRSKYTVGA